MSRRTSDLYDAFGERRSLLPDPPGQKFTVATTPRETQADRLERDIAAAIDAEDADYLMLDDPEDDDVA